MKKIVVIIVLGMFIFSSSIFSQESFSWKGKIVSFETSDFLPGAYIKVISNKRSFLFASDSQGDIEVFYINPTSSDSVLISYMGYKKLLVSKEVAFRNEVIKLHEDVITLNDVFVRPQKLKKIKLGNTALFTPFTARGGFGHQKVLYIPNNGVNGKIIKIRYFMTDPMMHGVNGSKSYPFRVRLYGKDTINNIIGEDLLKENLIVSLNKGNWLEVDLSSYNIKIPKSGVFVGIEMLASEYYLSNKIITKKEIGKHRTLNTVSIGITKRSKNSQKEFESWDYYSSYIGWTRKFCKELDYLINIIVSTD